MGEVFLVRSGERYVGGCFLKCVRVFTSFFGFLLGMVLTSMLCRGCCFSFFVGSSVLSILCLGCPLFF